MPKAPMTKELAQQARDLRERGYRRRDISRILKYSQSTIRRRTSRRTTCMSSAGLTVEHKPGIAG